MEGLRSVRSEIEVYNGYPIFHLLIIDKRSKFISKHNTFEYYGVCVKGGNYKLSRDRYENVKCRIEQAREMVDEIENGKVYLTESEHSKWVTQPNRKYGFGFTKKRLMNIWDEYPKADERRKLGYLERLHDANFHSEADAIEEGNFEAFGECLKELYG